MKYLKDIIRTVPDFPIAGVQFRDITSLLEDPQAFGGAVQQCCFHAHRFGADNIIGIESRGFVFGAPLARELELPFVMARKPGKLPGHVYRIDYELEYGTASLNIQCNTDIVPDDNVVIIDDLIATGGTALACANLVHTNFNIPKTNILVLSIIDLPDLGGSQAIKDAGYEVATLIEFEGE